MEKGVGNLLSTLDVKIVPEDRLLPRFFTDLHHPKLVLHPKLGDFAKKNVGFDDPILGYLQ